ncbi:hypothetical protein ACFQE1_20570 [Halobium palmae]|uniref:Uncharacterized protein n=1 Tax=Halobium palmae TaxID=1776492 RepID=A0ABD5S4V6_9EURY
MSDEDDLEDAVGTFLGDAETVLSEYDQGYMDADAALDLLIDHIDDLEDAYEA